MPSVLRRLTAACAAVTMLTLATSVAPANRLAIQSNSDIAFIWSGLRVLPPVGDTVQCGVTLIGHFHSLTIAKTVGSLIGLITQARLGSCNGGSATILSETLPWHITYNSFSGRLPNITQGRFSLINVSLQINNDTATCLVATTTGKPVIGTFNLSESGVVNSLQASGSIDLSGPELCRFLSANGQFEGAASVTHLEGDLVVIRLF